MIEYILIKGDASPVVEWEDYIGAEMRWKFMA
jgi:hypothetical protein